VVDNRPAPAAISASTSRPRRIFPAARLVMEVRSIDAIVAMVSAGLGVSIVPQP